MTECRLYLVSGRVQGVFFRASTARQASRLGIRGWAKNLPDGRVEVLACGERAALAQLEDWLWDGPATAEVDDVVSRPAEVEPPSGFVAR
ncbi:MAG: acylphosphatase [Gammaproteobacteria bacterium]|jgi:acylphosphatase